MLLNDPTQGYYPAPPVPASSNPLCSNGGIRNLILGQLHIRNLVSLGYTKECEVRGGRERGRISKVRAFEAKKSRLTPVVESFVVGWRRKRSSIQGILRWCLGEVER
ncbi:hypothetical protein V1477_009863 [Vespula maculifrons]|uniref:Uncharacterized protein n=2 Tax=Vespula TaxID=7451 RepID=A0A834N6W9_VESVU|nr:hypothetical protein HZH66_007435 [Vespula vulgaris]